MIDETKLAQYIDYTLLKPNTTLKMLEKLCQEAVTYHFKTVCINPCYVKKVVQFLKNNHVKNDVKVCTVIGFPLGANTTAIKVQETIIALQDGATEIDVVINIGALKDNNHELVLQELQAIRNVCPKHIILKVIIECSLLTKQEKIIACQIVTAAKANFIKTSTGFTTGGATRADLELMKKNIGTEMEIKASGGIKTRADALAMLRTGATRIGTSNGVSIIKNEQGQENY